MKAFLFSFLLPIVVIACNRNIKEINASKLSTNTIRFHDLSCDSISENENYIVIFCTDYKNYYDPVLSEQKTVYILSQLHLEDSSKDSIRFVFNMPNREPGTIYVTISVDYFSQARSVYDMAGMYSMMKYINYYDSIDINHHYLGGINAELAYIIYEKNTLENAFFGINSLNLFYDFLNECKTGSKTQVHQIIEKYASKINQYEADERSIGIGLINLLNEQCKALSGQGKK